MNDITMCSNDKCKIKEKCLRATTKPNELYQSYAHFVCDDGEYFLDNKQGG